MPPLKDILRPLKEINDTLEKEASAAYEEYERKADGARGVAAAAIERVVEESGLRQEYELSERAFSRLEREVMRELYFRTAVLWALREVFARMAEIRRTAFDGDIPQQEGYDQETGRLTVKFSPSNVDGGFRKVDLSGIKGDDVGPNRNGDLYRGGQMLTLWLLDPPRGDNEGHEVDTQGVDGKDNERIAAAIQDAFNKVTDKEALPACQVEVNHIIVSISLEP